MKKAIGIVVAVSALLVGYLMAGSHPARAYPGMMCIDSAACGDKCEVCVKDTATSPTGKCHKIAGCF